MSQLPRLLSILTLLRSKRILTGTELSKKFEVSLRTIYRDIKKLEESGVPIITIEGRGYSLMEGYNVPPINFNEKEANALITAENLIGQTKDESLIDNFQEALIKIKSIFRNNVLEKSETLNRKMLVFDNSKGSIRTNSLSELQLAITNFNPVEINYKKENNPDETFRLIEPAAIYCSLDKWILIGWCHLRKKFRAFRIDRIRKFVVLDETFEDRKFDIRKYFLSCPNINYSP